MNTNLSFDKLPEAVSELTKEVSELKKIMLESRQQNTPTTPPDPLLNIQQAATFLSLTVNTLYTKVSKGELPAMKRGNRLYFSQNELMAYLKEGRKKTNVEIAAEAANYLKKKGGNNE